MATKTPFPERVALSVDAAIGEAGETSTSIADATGIPRSTLRRRLLGSSPFTVAEIASIAHHLGTTPEILISGQVTA
jgi:hypothetical protein